MAADSNPRRRDGGWCSRRATRARRRAHASVSSVNVRPFGCRSGCVALTRSVSCSKAPIGRRLLDPVGDVDEADRRKGERRDRSAAACGAGTRARAGRWRAGHRASLKPADPRVLGEPAGVDLDVRQLELEIGHRAAAAGQERQLAAARNRAEPRRARTAAGSRARIRACLASCAQQALAADADHVAVHAGRAGAGEPGDRLGDVDAADRPGPSSSSAGPPRGSRSASPSSSRSR